ncbi:zf-CCHC domain-containing protein [Tanacetum coccineum]
MHCTDPRDGGFVSRTEDSPGTDLNFKCGFARFNTIITSLKALDEGFSSKNYVRKFLRALHPKWRAKVTEIEESKDLSSIALDELIGNLKVHEVVMEKDFEYYRGKKEKVKSIALKAKKESIDDETLTSRSDDVEYAMAVRNFKKFFRRKGKFFRQPREEKKSFRQRDEKKGKSDRKCFICGDPNYLIGDCPKPSRNKDQKAFIGGSWSDSENDAEDKTNDETCGLLEGILGRARGKESWYYPRAIWVFPGKFRRYKLTTEEEVEENEGLKEVWEKMDRTHPLDRKDGVSVREQWLYCEPKTEVASCFVNKALTWWSTQVQARGREAAIGMSWNDFKALLVEEFCPSNEMEKLENEF